MKEETFLQLPVYIHEKGVESMRRVQSIICASLIVGSFMVNMFGCASKSVQSGGETQASRPETKSGAGQDLPDTSFSGRDSSGGLRGLDKNPSEERLGSGGSLMAKADPGSAGRQIEDIRAEQAAAAAGLRDVFFAFDSFAISEDGRQVLAHDAEWVKANPGAQVKIEGHCDERGTSAYNLVLGEKRAKAARNYLVELGVTPNHLSIVSYGKERPVCKEHAESCYAQNRRAHMLLRTGK
ncbi:MAG: peptidoglycan-associated lipoprotein Pal [Nitrospira sp.]|nr:peptidoglycan-associated lipoprotein Pal [Nitrospira sp.]